MIPSQQPEFDFEHELPPGREFFRIPEVATLWRCSEVHIIRLVESGELEVAVDLRGAGASKSMLRIPRASLVKFLNKRKEMAR